MQSMKHIIADDLKKYKSNKSVEIFQIAGQLLDFRQCGPVSQRVNSGLVTRSNLKKNWQLL